MYVIYPKYCHLGSSLCQYILDQGLALISALKLIWCDVFDVKLIMLEMSVMGTFKGCGI